MRATLGIDNGVDTLTYAHARGDDRLAVHTLRCMHILMFAAAYNFFDVLLTFHCFNMIMMYYHYSIVMTCMHMTS